MKKWQCALAAAVWLSMASVGAHGESYPNKAVTLVVTAAPGGVTDILARALGQRMGKIWGQEVVVENKPGVPIAMNKVERSTNRSRPARPGYPG
jgi:tripartite-type tricarboxylate transporter receptor subunit TctC